MKCLAHVTVILTTFLITASCQSPQRVQAAREDSAGVNQYGQGRISGDLYSIDSAEKTIVIRVENGMAQTFRWDDDTLIDGDLPPADPKSNKDLFDTPSVLKRLSRRPGSELEVEWRDVNGEKLATAVHVTSLGALSSQKLRKKRARAQ
jgi:hypothetical protein